MVLPLFVKNYIEYSLVYIKCVLSNIIVRERVVKYFQFFSAKSSLKCLRNRPLPYRNTSRLKLLAHLQTLNSGSQNCGAEPTELGVQGVRTCTFTCKSFHRPYGGDGQDGLGGMPAGIPTFPRRPRLLFEKCKYRAL